MGRKLIDLTGREFGKLIVLEYAGKHTNPGGSQCHKWLCKCECGTTKEVIGTSLLSGKKRCCGCTYVSHLKTHGLSGKKEYKIWGKMIQRCTNPNAVQFDYYGARGITVCERWLESFESFYEDMGERPTPKHTLDRIDNNKGYCKENCRWATRKEQNRNTRRNKFLTCNNETKCVSEWAEIMGISPRLIRDRIKLNWNVQDAITIPARG